MRTKHKHVAFLPFPHYPHILPTLSFSSVLIRRGLRVSYVVPELFDHRIREIGAEVVRGPSYITLSSTGQPVFGDICQLTDQAIDYVTHFYENNRPDLIIYDRAYFAGRILAKRWNIRTATTTSVLAFELANTDLLGKSARAWRDALVRSNHEIDTFLCRRGIERANTFFHRERLNIHLFPRLYQLAGSVFDEADFYAGRCAAELPSPGVWRPREQRYPHTILVSTSTAYLPGSDYFATCIEALENVPAQVILSLGDRNNYRLPSELPPNFEVFQNMPQIKAMPYADVFVCKAGPASASEALYHGVPLLMITHGDIDPESYAENAERLGMGTHLRGTQVSALQLRQSVLEILGDEKLAKRMKRLSHIVRREPGGEETANRIEDYLEESD